MLQVARLAHRQLGEATGAVTAFLEGQLTEDGGARDRSGKSDLYYTAFLLDACIALQSPLPAARVRPYLEGFGRGEGLDLVHLACLARCWRALEEPMPAGLLDHVTGSFEACRAPDGGYSTRPGGERGTVYNAFLALGAYQDLGLSLPAPEELAASIQRNRAEDGSYADGESLPVGTTPTSAAAIALLHHLGDGAPDETVRWILARAHPQGGFRAVPDAPFPDLLSTATSLHALSMAGAAFNKLREPCLDLLDSLWTGKSFVAHWEDEEADCEYAFYALLALGHLAV